MSTIDFEAKDKADRKDGFARWKDQPATRMMMSMIPPCEKPEILETLLQETFNAGFNSGGGKMIGSVIEALLKGKDQPRPRD